MVETIRRLDNKQQKKTVDEWIERETNLLTQFPILLSAVSTISQENLVKVEVERGAAREDVSVKQMK